MGVTKENALTADETTNTGIQDENTRLRTKPSNSINRWECGICGHSFPHGEAPEKCPICHVPLSIQQKFCVEDESISQSEGILSAKEENLLSCINKLSEVGIKAERRSDDVIIISAENCNKDALVVPEGVTRIGEQAFSQCSSIHTIALPSSIKAIDAYAFEGCESLENIKFAYGIRSIGTAAFRNCTCLRSVSFSNSITSIGPLCFEKCISLQAIALPPKLKLIQNGLFCGCSHLQEITLPVSIEEIMFEAFAYTNLKRMELPKGIVIWGDVFRGLPLTCKIRVPDDLILHGEWRNPFSGLSKKQIEIYPANGKKTIEWCGELLIQCENSELLACCSDSDEIIVPERITSIASSAFSNCPNLRRVYLPKSLRSIGKKYSAK